MCAVTSWQRRTVVLVVGWAVMALSLTLVGQAITGPLESTMEPAESDLARWISDQRTPALNDVAPVVSVLGGFLTLLVLVPLIALGLWVWKRDARLMLFAVLSCVGAAAMYYSAAVSVDRERPPVRILDPGLDPLHSYPSGHVAAATALYGMLMVLAWTYAGRRARGWATLLLVLPLLVAASRLYEGAHHLSDVLSSLLFVSAWVVVAAIVLLSDRAAHAHRLEGERGEAVKVRGAG